MTKTIDDIKCANDMYMVAIEIDEHITQLEKTQLIGLCDLMRDKDKGSMCFIGSDRYVRLICDDTDERLIVDRGLNSSKLDYTVINYKDFLRTTTKGATMKHAIIINNEATLFETEEEARTFLETGLDVGMTGYLATNILKLEAVKKFKTTNMVKKKKAPVKKVAAKKKK